MTLDQLLALGATHSAGHVDIFEPESYGGRHTRLAELLVSGALIYTPEGEAWVAQRKEPEVAAEPEVAVAVELHSDEGQEASA